MRECQKTYQLGTAKHIIIDMKIVSDLTEPKILIEFTPHARLQYQEKMNNGAILIDLRVWIKWAQDQQFHPGKNAMMMEKSKWIEIMPKLQELLNDK